MAISFTRWATSASNANAQSSALGQSITQLTNQQSAVSGVNIDEETTNLIRYQTAYEAGGTHCKHHSGTQHRDP